MTISLRVDESIGRGPALSIAPARKPVLGPSANYSRRARESTRFISDPYRAPPSYRFLGRIPATGASCGPGSTRCDLRRQEPAAADRVESALIRALPSVLPPGTWTKSSPYSWSLPLIRPVPTEELVALGARVHHSRSPSTSSGLSTRTFAPFARSSSAVRNPHSAPTGNIPAARAVFMSVPVSPR